MGKKVNTFAKHILPKREVIYLKKSRLLLTWIILPSLRHNMSFQALLQMQYK